MGVLTKPELIELANTKGLLGGDYDINNFEPSSYDLRIGTVFKGGQIFNQNTLANGFNNNIEIKPSEIVTILTLEEVLIPKDCIGTVFALNSLSSTGLLILNPGHIDPGFKGPISICAINLSNQVKRLHIKQKIFTLLLETTNQPLSDQDKYNGNKTISRKEWEEKFNRENASQLSSSFFDLISTYKETPYFRDQVLSIFKEKMWEYAKKGIKFISMVGALIIFLITVIAFFKDDVSQKELDIKLEKVTKNYDSIQLVNQTLLKEIIKENKALTDSLNVIKTKIKVEKSNGKKQ